MAATQTDPNWEYNGEPLEETNRIVRPPPPSANVFNDDLRTTMLANCLDGIHAAWNGWEQAVTFKDEGMQTYYMKYIIILQGTMDKIKKI